MATKDKATPMDPKPQPKQCPCGCGGPTKGRFGPGHDARFKGILTRTEAEEAREDYRVSGEALAYASAAKPTYKVVASFTAKDVIRLASKA